MIRQAPRSTRTDTLFPYTTLFDLTAGLLGSVLVNQFKTDYLNEALYTQATYKIVDQLSVTGGIRYTWDRTKGYGIKDRYAFALTAPLPVKQQGSRPEVKRDRNSAAQGHSVTVRVEPGGRRTLTKNRPFMSLHTFITLTT